MRNESPQGAARQDVLRIILGFAGLFVVIGGGVLFAAVSSGSPLVMDSWWADLMARLRWGPLLALAHALAAIGGTVGVIVITAVIAAVMLIMRHPRTAVAVVAAVSLSALASSLLKLLVERPRPDTALDHLLTSSYPSGHATSAAALAVTLALALPRVWSWIAAVGWMLLLAWSRTYLEVHWLTDVLAGAVLGLSIAVIVDGAIRMLDRRFPSRWWRS